MPRKDRVVAVHQPNFFPWLGYFAKINAADIFICLDDAQLTKTGGSWSNRVKLSIGGRPQWMTAAVDRSRAGVQPICESYFAETGWKEKMLRSISQSYAKSPHFHETMDLIAALVQSAQNNIADYNLAATQAICAQLAIDTPIARASTMSINAKATDRLVALVERADGTGYLSGDGADGYQIDELFEHRQIALGKLDFRHPPYPQCNSGSDEFVPGLSVIDALMNIGFEATRGLLDRVRSSVRT